ncbi:MAG: polysaccharide biosynthesis protein, partial [Flavobacteriales bacterium]|nr:polysaccharide biosynthesis protein [Flavobacteriales bacterium]
SGVEDSVRIIKVIAVGSFIMAVFNPLKFFLWDGAYFIPFSIIIIDAFFACALLILFRLAVKLLYVEIKNPRSERSNVLIYGAGEAGLIAKRAIDRDAGMRYHVLAFVDDDPKKSQKRVEGAPIIHSSNLDAYLKKRRVENIIVSIQKPKIENKRKVLQIALKNRVKALNVPPVTDWINGELSFKQIKQVKIDDLLGREVISLDDGNVEKQLRGKTVLITGAAGSIGSGLVMQIASYKPKLIVALDQSESPLYELEIELRKSMPEIKLEVVIGDIRRLERIKNVFRHFDPDVVFHAAAYKHVPLMELNPTEAVLTIYAQTCNTRGKTSFITTRFGNVLGSNGSVIPLFKKQIEAGGPVTVTDPEITRYFMTIPEACQLVLEAGAMGEGGEIFVFDMGQSVKIIDLAKQMISLSGLELGKDIEIKITGLRPGEKLYEELLNDEENTLPTHHPQIKRAKVRKYEFDEISTKINMLIDDFNSQNNDQLVRHMKDIVPEFISNNSEFSKFDA